MRVLIGVLVISILFLTACKKVESGIEGDETRLEEATIRWTGSYATDGCGYIFDVNCLDYKADNEEVIDSSFQITQEQKVIIEFTTIDNGIESYCLDSIIPRNFNGLHIISMKRK